MYKYLILMFMFFSGTAAFSQTQSLSSIVWEVTNRFAPFETQDNPEKVFEEYALLPGEDFNEWHRRLAKKGIKSPYRDILKNKEHRSKLHWDQDASSHDPRILDFIRKEEAPTTTVSVRVRLDRTGDCIWTVGIKEKRPCRDWNSFRIPLSGGKVGVAVDGVVFEKMIKPEHVVIVAMGDSYGSGEGNPDYPVAWKSKMDFGGSRTFGWLKNSGRLEDEPESFDSETKHWVDDNCHRSFFSHQSLTAFRMASEVPHRFVSFLHYACTGAEIFDGILVPQYQAWGENGIYLPYSQLNFAIRDLCISPSPAIEYEAVTSQETYGIDITSFHRRGGKGNSSVTASSLVPNTDRFSKNWAVKVLRERNGGDFPNSGILQCPGKIRPPDHLFISIGGNDTGFGDIVTYFLVPSEWGIKSIGKILFPDVCPRPGNRVNSKTHKLLTKHCHNLDVKNLYHAGDLIGKGKPYGMGKRYALLFNILKARLGVQSEQIVLPQYPDPLRNRQSRRPACEALADDEYEVYGVPAKQYDPVSPWNGLKAAAPDEAIALIGGNMQRWQFNLTRDDGKLALRQIDEFRVEAAKAGAAEGINFICETRDAFVGYGWWKGTHLHLPNASGPDGQRPWDPATWDPYAYEEDTRAIRTGNDTVLTQPGDKRVTGTIHPNLTGHRLVAELVFQRLQK